MLIKFKKNLYKLFLSEVVRLFIEGDSLRDLMRRGPVPARQACRIVAALCDALDYAHNRTGEDNGDAHLKRQVMGREVVVAITQGRLDFGPWEQIFYGEFDGGRKKRVLVKIIGE